MCDKRVPHVLAVNRIRPRIQGKEERPRLAKARGATESRHSCDAHHAQRPGTALATATNGRYGQKC